MKLTCQHKDVVARLSLLDDVAALWVAPPVHAFHHVFDLLGVQSLQKLVLIEGVCDEFFLTMGAITEVMKSMNDSCHSGF